MHLKTSTRVALLCLLAAVSPAAAESSGFEVADLSFFAGSWQGELFGGQADETWMAPRDGTMLGAFRLTWEDGRRLYEFLVIEQNDDGDIEMAFRHFDPGMGLWEREIDKPLQFKLVEVGENLAVFEAPDRTQQPAIFRFALDSESDRLTITVASLDEKGEVKESFDAQYQRLDP